MSLLGHAADWFKARNTGIRTWYEDDNGRYAFRVTVEGQDFVVCAKKYLHDGDASFMRKVVLRAADLDAYILLFVQGDGRRLLFDPQQVQDQGTPSDPSESQRAQQGERWLDVPTDWTVTFEEWYDDGKEPVPTATDGSGGGQDADDSRPDRHWDITAWGDDDV